MSSELLLIIIFVTVILPLTIKMVVQISSYRDNQQDLIAHGKRKNDHLPPVDPLDVLTDDDLAELRQEVKEEIRERLRYGSDDEVSSLDDLLAEPPDSAKRKTHTSGERA